MHNILLQFPIEESMDTIYQLLISTGFFLVLLFGFLFANRFYKQHMEARKKKLKNRLELLLTGIVLLGPGDWDQKVWEHEKEKIINHFKKNYLHSSFNRKVLVDELMILHRSYRGEISTRARDLYFELGLDKSSIKALLKSGATQRANIIRDLAQVGVSEAIPLLWQQLTHPSPFVQLESRIALFKLDGENLFALIDENTILGRWEKIKLFEVFRHIESDQLPMFGQWLRVNNISVQLFCLELIGYFRQNAAAEECIKLLQSSSLEVRCKVLEVLSKLDKFNFIDEHLTKFPELTEQEQIGLLKCMAVSKEQKYHPFLTNIINHSASKALALEAGRAAKLLCNDDDQMLRKQYRDHGNEQLQKVFNHLADYRLQ